ncbi:MAG: PTS sugar transporter subunit IIA [Treponema sp.]|nr:PTS sugar transporter subunit IIA [Treponema sp.]MBQ5383967.1 PTS sugar transporter subunit IIA [Treponema sp.]
MVQENCGDFNVLCSLIKNGGIVANAEGSVADEIFESVCSSVEMPEGVERDFLKTELSEREKILSTAVGHGVAIPHPRKSILQKESDQRIIVCYPKNRIDMSSPDGTTVFVMFILLTKETKVHLGALSDLAKLVHCLEFRQFLETKPDAAALVEKISFLHESGKLG